MPTIKETVYRNAATSENIKKRAGYFKFRQIAALTFDDLTATTFATSSITRWGKLKR